MHELAFASLTWREAPMPGAAPVQMALLPKLADGGFRAFVRFPKGWSRPDVGHYAVAEEFVSLISFDRWRSIPGVGVKVAGL